MFSTLMCWLLLIAPPTIFMLGRNIHLLKYPNIWHFFVLWYWIDVSPAMAKMFQWNFWWKLNNLLVMFLMKSHYHSLGLLELHQCWCEWEGISKKSSIETIEIHMVSDSHSMSESQRNNGHETLTSWLRRERASH